MLVTNHFYLMQILRKIISEFSMEEVNLLLRLKRQLCVNSGSTP